MLDSDAVVMDWEVRRRKRMGRGVRCISLVLFWGGGLVVGGRW